jgi:Flp pilus assembly protein TadB
MKNDAVEFEFRALADYALLMQASARSGASISQPLSNLASTMIRNRTQEQLLTTELASTKATILVLAGLPIIGSGLAMMLGSQSINWLFTTGVGRSFLLIGIALELLGWAWVQRLLATALRDPL